VVALAGNLDFAGSRFLTGLTAVFIARLREAPAWKVRTLTLLNCRHHCSPFRNRSLNDCGRHQWCRYRARGKAAFGNAPELLGDSAFKVMASSGIDPQALRELSLRDFFSFHGY
jgi:hypothetical protein